MFQLKASPRCLRPCILTSPRSYGFINPHLRFEGPRNFSLSAKVHAPSKPNNIRPKTKSSPIQKSPPRKKDSGQGNSSPPFGALRVHNPYNIRPKTKSSPIQKSPPREKDSGQADPSPRLGATLLQQNPDGTMAGFMSEEESMKTLLTMSQMPRYITPFIFAVGLSAGTFTLFAYLEAKKQDKKEERSWSAKMSGLLPSLKKHDPTPLEVISNAWKDQNPMDKLAGGIIATSGAIFAGNAFSGGRLYMALSAMPYVSAWNYQNYRFLTSTFVHFGVFHLLVNAWACYQFLPSTGNSPLFGGNTNHMLAFFLSTGVLSGYGQHLSTWRSTWTWRADVVKGRLPAFMIRSGGASGALYAVFGAFCMQYPDAGVGLIFIPFSIAASTFLPFVMAFDAYGMVRGFPRLNLGHAAHLSGAILGVSYSLLDGRTRIWDPLVMYFRRRNRDKRGRRLGESDE